MWEYTVAFLSAALDTLLTTSTRFLSSSEHHLPLDSSTTSTGENRKDTKALKKEYTVKEDARKRAIAPMLADFSCHMIDKFFVASSILSPGFWPQMNEIHRQCWALFEHLQAVPAQPPLQSPLQELTSKTPLTVTNYNIFCLATEFTMLSIHYICGFGFWFWYPAFFNASKRIFLLWRFDSNAKEVVVWPWVDNRYPPQPLWHCPPHLDRGGKI